MHRVETFHAPASLAISIPGQGPLPDEERSTARRIFPDRQQLLRDAQDSFCGFALERLAFRCQARDHLVELLVIAVRCQRLLQGVPVHEPCNAEVVDVSDHQVGAAIFPFSGEDFRVACAPEEHSFRLRPSRWDFELWRQFDQIDSRRVRVLGVPEDVDHLAHA